MILQKTLAVFFLACTFILPAQSLADDWSYQAELYLQATNIYGETSSGRLLNGATVDLDSSDIFSNLELGGMFHFEALNQPTGWGLLLDYGFMDLGVDNRGPAGYAKADADIRQAVLEALVFKRQMLGSGSLDLFAGIHWWDNDIDIKLSGPIGSNPQASIAEDWIDVIAGARWMMPLNKNWGLVAKGDIGGFGLSAEFTSTLALGAQYQLNESYTLDLQYKAAWVDYENGSKGTADYFAYDTVTHGPLIGIIYNF